MSNTQSNTKQAQNFTHLVQKERELIEQWFKEAINVSHIAKRLGRNRSTIHRELNRGTVTQMKIVNGYEQTVERYYSDAGQAIYEKNRKNSRSKKRHAFSQDFFRALEAAHKEKQFTGKKRTYNIKTFIHHYAAEHPEERVPTFKTIYTYIREGEVGIKPHDLPLMYRLAPRKNGKGRPKGTNKRLFGQSISERPDSVLERNELGHWEADLVKGKRTKKEPAIITLVERKTRYAITKKIVDYKSKTVKEAFDSMLSEYPNDFLSITFDNGSEFSLMSDLSTDVYFCHAYSAWERGTNENFNQLLREFIPKGISLHQFSERDIYDATEAINQRVREVIDYQTAQNYFKQLCA